ncbi:MAG TPA: hypothetical protein VLB29_17180 [Nocardioidaceae bacterium]|nr:hypothetical protein [Nocardioidaceae bacterium]
MTVRSLLRRAGVVAAASTALVLVGTSSASAWHCFLPVYDLDRAPASANWFVAGAEEGAFYLAGYTTPCAGAVDAGYAALEAAGMPVGIRIFEKMTIGEGNNNIARGDEEAETSGSGQGAATNPNGGNGTGLEYLGSEPQWLVDMIGTYVAAAEEYDCGTTTASS